MSYDILVWKARTTRAEDASSIDERPGDLLRADEYERSEDLLHFYDELLARFPPLESFADGDSNIRRSPWSATPKRSDRYLELNVRPRTADHVYEAVLEVARTHQLVVSDPRGPTVYSPDEVSRGEPEVRYALIGGVIGLLLAFVGTLIPYRILSWPITGVGILMIVVMGSYTLVVVGRKIRPLVRRARGHSRTEPQLGTLVRDVKGHYWMSTMTLPDRSVDVVIEGDEQPNPELLAAARQLVADFDALERRADAYLTTEAKDESDPELALEIRALRISSIKLWTPDRPAHVVLDFEGLDEGRYWYCQYVDGEFSDLRFDT